MKRLLNILVVGLGIGLLSACSSTGSVVSGSDPYRYYDDMYYYGYPSYYNAYPYYHRPVIHDRVIVVPEQNRRTVRSRTNDLRGREAVAPNMRRSVQPSSREVIRSSTAPTRRSTTVAPSSRQSSSAPATRNNSSNGSRRGNN